MAKGKKSTMKDKGTKDTKSSGGKGATIFLIIIALIIIAVMRTGFIFILMAMLPTIIAYYLDTKRPRTKFHTVFACNFSGVFPFIIQLLKEGPNASGYTTEVMSNMLNWLIIYGSAGFGYLLIGTTPLMAQMFISLVNKGQISRYESMQQRIIKEWGNEVSRINQAKENE